MKQVWKYLRFEARAIYPDHATKYYTMALWSGDPSGHPRESATHQKDAVYLIYPDHTQVPEDRFGHWDSRSARQ